MPARWVAFGGTQGGGYPIIWWRGARNGDGLVRLEVAADEAPAAENCVESRKQIDPGL